MAVYKEAVHYEKDRCSTMVKAISVLESQHAQICNVLGEKDVFCSEEFQRSASLSEIHACLTRSLKRLDVFKKQRLKNLQSMQDKMIDLWDLAGVTIEEQKQYSYMMQNTVATLDEVNEKNALSADLLTKIEAELKRLESLCKVTERDILERAEAVFSSQRESSSHSEATVKKLIDRVKAWEAKNERKFMYDKKELITELLEPLKAKHYQLSDAIQRLDDAAGAERDHSPTWSDSWAEGSEDSESDHESQDPDFTASESEEEL